MTIDPTTMSLVHTLPGAADVTVERDLAYTGDPTPLTFDLYRPLRATTPCPAVVLVSGLPDPGVARMLGKPIKNWASYQGWARLLAASGMAGITYTNREPADVAALVRHLRANAGALGLDPARIGVWACSGNVPMALSVIAHEHPAAAALLYGFTLDLDGATTVAEGSKKYYFAAPPVTLDELPRGMPMLVVRAGRDSFAGINETIGRFVDAARERQLPVTLLEHPEGQHSFDLVDDTPMTHQVIEEVLAFLRRSLA